MPWSETSSMDQRTQFIADYLRESLNVTGLWFHARPDINGSTAIFVRGRRTWPSIREDRFVRPTPRATQARAVARAPHAYRR